MTRHIVPASSPLSALSLPATGSQITAITRWAQSCLVAGHRIYVPEVIDYELRHELLCSGKTTGIAELDGLESVFRYLPLTTVAMLQAADLWAHSRNSGQAMGDPKRLDIDVTLAAQALTLSVPASDITVATINVKHLSRFVSTDEWINIKP